MPLKQFIALTVLGAALVGLVPSTGGVPRAADGYSVSTIDIPGSISTVANGIDILGRAVGYYTDSAGTHGFLASSSGVSKIDYPGAAWTAAYGINAAGQVVGAYGPNGAAGRHGFLLGDGKFSSFDVPGGTDTVARGMNSRGQIVGDFLGPDGVRHGFLLSGGAYNTVDAPESGGGSATAINDAGQIVGLAGTSANAKGFFYDSRSFSKVEFPASNYTEVLGLNNVGDLVGLIDNPQAPSRGFRRGANGFVVMELPDGPASWDARGVNDLGQIVGSFTGRDGKTHGYRATPTVLRDGPSESLGVTRLTDPSSPRGRGTDGNAQSSASANANASPRPAGERGDSSSQIRMGRVVRELESTRDGFRRISGALERAIMAASDREREREKLVGHALAALEIGLNDADAAIAYVKEHPDEARTEAPKSGRIEFTFPPADRGRNPSLQSGLNQLNITIRSLLQVPGGDLGGYRAKLLDDLTTAAAHIIAANHAPRDSRGRGGRGERGPVQPSAAAGAGPAKP